MNDENNSMEYLKNKFGLENKTALVTGGNGGLGLAIAKGLGMAGAKVVIIGRNDEKNRKSEAELVEQGTQVYCVKADVTQSKDVRHAVAMAMDRFGSLDILVNSAGITMAAPAHQMTESQFGEVMSTNLKGTLLCCQEAYKVMKGIPQSPTKIINIASAYGFFGGAFVSAYSASKGGVIQLTRSLAVEWASKNIRVNAIVPGWFETAMTATMRMVPDSVKNIIRRTPLGRFGAPDEVAGTAVFLSSRSSDFLTGACIVVDGGYSITM